jgi:NAD-dependent SIR2 family protein deacetylase
MNEKKCHCIDCFNSWTQEIRQPPKCSACGNMNPNNMLIFEWNGAASAAQLAIAKAPAQGIRNPMRPA